MDPKFQSYFIPKGPVASTVPNAPLGRRVKERNLLSFLALIIFTLSIILAIGVFGYKFYLKYRIEQMGTDLESARATLQPEVIRELTRLDNRIITAKQLIAEHQILSPLFEFLEVSTPETVRFNDFRYAASESGLELFMRGEARGYGALALQADILQNSEYFQNIIFSNLDLNTRGDVTFSLKMTLEPSLVSYQKAIELIALPSVPLPSVATSTVTSTPN